MNVNYKWGIYNEGGLVNISAGLNITPTYYFELKKLLHVRRIKGFPMVRVGAKTGDGGYVMVKDFVDSGIAYSFGISGDVSWDKDMAERGYDVYMYDHTITSLPEENEKFHFFQEGIGFEFDPYGPLDTLSSYIARNNHSATKNMILKIDTGSGKDHYDATVKDHYHFVCKACDRVHDVNIPAIMGINEQVAKSLNVTVENNAMLFFGKCKDCK